MPEGLMAIFLVRWVPDPVRDEATNMGVLVFDEEGGSARRCRGDAPEFVRDFVASASEDDCEWMAGNGHNLLQVRRMVGVSTPLQETLDREWLLLVVPTEEEARP